MPVSIQTAATHETLAATPRRSARRSLQTANPLALWHLLSLDAPTVAALWVVFVARAAHIVLPWTAPAAMFLAVWILYAIDRLLDARSRRSGALEARHHFHAAHARTFLAAIALAAPALALLIRDIQSAAIRLYLLLGALLLAWLLLIHLPPATAGLPKELAVGIFFPAAVFIPTVARAPQLRPVLLPEAVLFAAVCSLNCLYIYAWEHPNASPDASRHESHWTTRWAIHRLRSLTLATFASSLLVIAAVTLARQSEPWHLGLALAIACALTAAFFLWTHGSRDRLDPIHLRAAADLCLLTPLLLLPLLR